MEKLQFWMVQRGLVMKIDRGMEWTGKISSLQVAKRNGWTDQRTARKALVQINEMALANSLPLMWSEKYPDDASLMVPWVECVESDVID